MIKPYFLLISTTYQKKLQGV